MPTGTAALTANEAASVTRVPLKQVHRIIDAGLLSGTIEMRGRSRVIGAAGLVGLRVAYLTADTLTLDARRRVVANVIRQSGVGAVQEQAVTVQVKPIAQEVEEGLDALARAKTMVMVDKEIMGGTPCIVGTRIPVHLVADMLESGNSLPTILEAYPRLAPEQVELAHRYANAYPLRGRPPLRSWRQKMPPKSTRTYRLDDLPIRS